MNARLMHLFPETRDGSLRRGLMQFTRDFGRTVLSASLRSRRLPLLLLAAVFMFEFTRRFHEPWRDEAETVLVGRASFSDILYMSRLAGIPPGIFLLMKSLDSVLGTWSLPALAALGYVVLLRGVHEFMSTVAGRTEATLGTAILALTYPCVFEGGVIARQYALSLGIAFHAIAAAIIYAEAPNSRPTRLAIHSALTSVFGLHGACIAASSALVACLWRMLKFSTPRPLLHGLACAPGPILALAYALPYEQRWVQMNATTAITWSDLPEAVTAVLGRAFFQKDGTWLRADLPAPRVVELVSALALPGMVLIVLFSFWDATQRRRGTIFALGWLISSGLLLYTFVAKAGATYRHFTFVALPALAYLTVFALAAARRAPWFGAVVLGLFAPTLALLNLLGLANLAADVADVFSDTRLHASEFEPHARLVTADARPVALLYYRPDLTLRTAANRGSHVRYIRPDKDFEVTVPVAGLIREECRASASGGVWASDPGGFPDCQKRHLQAKGRVEGFSWTELDCGCVAKTH